MGGGQQSCRAARDAHACAEWGPIRTPAAAARTRMVCLPRPARAAAGGAHLLAAFSTNLAYRAAGSTVAVRFLVGSEWNCRSKGASLSVLSLRGAPWASMGAAKAH